MPKKSQIPYNTTRIRSERLELRPYAFSDYESWRDGFAGRLPKQSKHDPGRVGKEHLTKEIFQLRVRRLRRLWEEDHIYKLGIFAKKSGAHLGDVDFCIFERLEWQWSNLGYEVHNHLWGHGYASEAAHAALAFGFKTLRLNRIEAAIDLDNKASIKVAKNAGMQKECVRKNFFFEHGQWVDHVIYAATPADVGLKATRPKY